MVLMHYGSIAEPGAVIYYMWDAMERECVMGDDGECTYAEGESPAEIAKSMEGDDINMM